VSSRVAWACAALTWAAVIVTFGRARRDYCDYALDKAVRPTSAEIWDWSVGRIRTQPVSEVQAVEGKGVGRTSGSAPRSSRIQNMLEGVDCMQPSVLVASR
jgi:hypothetical protein